MLVAMQWWLVALACTTQCSMGDVLVGVGRGDSTGAAADVTCMGYADSSQVTAGIHTRQHARCFIAHDTDTDKRFAFVSVDAGMGSSMVKRRVVARLAQLGLGDKYFDENIAISGTHTHSTPGGFLESVIYQITVMGYSKETTDSYVNGVVDAIVAADKDVRPMSVKWNRGKMAKDVASRNRSPNAYLFNSATERSLYPDGDTDLNMTQLNFFSAESGEETAIFNWFATHGTSLNNTNRLISGDNKGWASQVVERRFNSGPAQEGSFVAGFAATNLGDVSANTDGAKCQDTGLPCDRITSTCNGSILQCYALGPGTNGDMFESAEIVANHQVDLAMKLLVEAGEELTGPVDFRHAWVDFSKLVLKDSNKALCPPAMGFSFAAGTTDGAGFFLFEQGVNSSKSANPFWRLVGGLLSEPSKEQTACHEPKQILLNTGFMNEPYPWDPSTIPVQLLRIGKFFIISVPTEFTTMAGRRLRNAVAQTLVEEKVIAHANDGVFVIAGLSNGYSSYTTTHEEYQAQRYEGASTIFGPHEADGFNQELSRLARDMARGDSSTTLPPPPNHDGKEISFIPPVIVDEPGLRHAFGQPTTIPAKSYQSGRDTAVVTFQCANPRNNLRRNGSFLLIERQEGSGWVTVATDDSVETRFHFHRPSAISAQSFCDVEWYIPVNTPAGTYRSIIFGTHKGVTGKLTDFSGTSASYIVV